MPVIVAAVGNSAVMAELPQSVISARQPNISLNLRGGIGAQSA
jgi:hypothetical protein